MKCQTMAKTCPGCDGCVKQVELEKHVLFRGVAVTYTATLQQCVECGLELAGIEEAAAMQERLADAYRKAVGLLDSEDIRRLRQKKGLSQQGLADALDVGVASIKRWETGVIQSKSMDTLLRSYLQANPCSEHTGNRDFSIPRIRLVLEAFAAQLKRPLLKRDDRMLYAAKYLWYADMTAFRDLGCGMTGATYAALPMGPQLNNYRDLIDEILKADMTSAPPLSKSETALIAAIARTFPTNKGIYHASHREPIWLRCATGATIPYSHAADLIEMPRCKDLP